MVIIIVTRADTFIPEEVEDVEELRHGVYFHNVGAEGAAVVPRLLPRTLHEGVHQHATVPHHVVGAGARTLGEGIDVRGDGFNSFFGRRHRLGGKCE